MRLTRRELLTTFLGAPFALSACQKSNTHPRFPEGELVGQNVSLGHVLREHRSFEVSADKWQQKKIVIVGAGVAGLSAAWKLSKQGISDLSVIELEKEAGGTSKSGHGDPVKYPWGAHYLPVPFSENQELIELLDEMELIDGRTGEGDILIKEQYLCREPEDRIFYKGRWYEGLYLHAGESDEDKLQLKAFQDELDKWINWRDVSGRRAFVVPSGRGSDDAEVKLLTRCHLEAGFAVRFYFGAIVLVLRLCLSRRLRLKLEQTSAWAGLFYFCSRVKGQAVNHNLLSLS